MYFLKEELISIMHCCTLKSLLNIGSFTKLNCVKRPCLRCILHFGLMVINLPNKIVFLSLHPGFWTGRLSADWHCILRTKETGKDPYNQHYDRSIYWKLGISSSTLIKVINAVSNINLPCENLQKFIRFNAMYLKQWYMYGQWMSIYQIDACSSTRRGKHHQTTNKYFWVNEYIATAKIIYTWCPATYQPCCQQNSATPSGCWYNWPQTQQSHVKFMQKVCYMYIYFPTFCNENRK